MNGDERLSGGKAIYIAGPRRLDNEALARLLAREAGTPCEAVPFDRMVTLELGPHPPGSLLFLVDALDPGLRRAAPQGNGGANGMLPAGLFSLLFREHPNGNGAGGAAPVCRCGFFYRFESAEKFLCALQDLLADRRQAPGEPPVGYMRPGGSMEPAEGHPLSPREFHILFLMAGGLHNSDIAARLNISGHTVRTHLYNIFRKIHVRSRVQASLWVHEHVDRFFCVL